MRPDRNGSARPLVAVVTHRNLEGLRTLVPALLEQTQPLDLELVVVDNASQDGTREWLSRTHGPITVIRLPDNRGPAGAFNAVLETRPQAEAYIFFGDDATVRGNEAAGLLKSLFSNERLGIVAGEPVSEAGDQLASDYKRRPLERAFPLFWHRWWGGTPSRASGTLEYVDVVGGSGMALRGKTAREIGAFETILWPAGFEDLDYCARTRFLGWEIAVDHGLPIFQRVSVTMEQVFGQQYFALRRSSGLLYAALNYPLPFATGRLLEAGINALTSSDGPIRRGDAWGLLRCARSWRHLLRGRKIRRGLRRMRRTALS